MKEKIRQVFNKILLQKDCTPKAWKNQNTSRQRSRNYKPICSLPVLYKLFATVLWRVDTFGSLLPGQPCKVPPSTPALMLCVKLARPICEKYAAGEITNGTELKKLRDEAMVEQGFSKSTRAVAMKRLAATLLQDDAHTQPTTGQVLSTSPSIATPTPDVDDSSARPHYVAAAAATGRMRDPFGCPPAPFTEVSVRND